MAGTAQGSPSVGSAKPASRGAGPSSNLRNRKAKSSSNATSSAVSRAQDNSMWKFYTEDSPGIKVGPVPVLIMQDFLFYKFLEILNKISDFKKNILGL